MGSWKQSGRSSRGHSSLVEGPLLQGGPTLFQRFLSSMCTKPRLALISHLDFNLKWKLVCELLQQGCWLQCTHRPWVPKCAQNWGAQWCLLMQIHPGDPSGAYSCRPIHDISVCVTLLFFFLPPHGALKTCRTPQMGGAGCGTLSPCQEASLQSGHPSSPNCILMQPSSLPWWNGARLFLWSVKQLLDLSGELFHLKSVSDSGVLFVKNYL